ncbi:LAME_0H07932g1_1 [Lachancea meyersii CBS 8951]|uniref:Derlin n=1 Tax=Lachancea meyersii CBS 8951 TaxID=1266667 RepID=A0A1G4KFL2_9SACH|nr:LAME_0H07932g1_1 [Lachancea meyersii CBS 8951]
MDAIIFNLAGDVPAVTKAWAAGIIVLSVLTSTTIVDPSNTLYNFDLAFRRGQYVRVLYSFFDYGKLDYWFVFGVVVMLSQLADVEKAVQTRSQFLWMIFLLGGMVIGMSKWIQPYESLAHVVHKNLLYYKIRMDIQSVGNGGARVGVSPLMLRLSMDILQLATVKSMWGILITYLPGQLYFFVEQIVSKIYGVELCKPPNQWFQKSGPQENEDEQPLEE